jgi:hypothetical protein
MVTLPDASTANTDSNATLTADIAAAQAAFIASTTVLINNAISNGLFQVEPYIIPFLNISNVTTYFQGLGYTVLFPIIPPGPWNPCWPAAGFPEVIPSGWFPWGCQCGCEGPPRIQISWPPFPTPPPFPFPC